jgi:hypothetical protein
LTKKAPYKGLSADSEEKHVPASDVDTVAVDSLKALDPDRPIREADITHMRASQTAKPPVDEAEAATALSLTGRILRRGPCDAEIGNRKAAPYS